MVTGEEHAAAVPWFVRKAMLAQGKYDPDALPDVDLEAPTEPVPAPPAPEPEQTSLPVVHAPTHWQDRG